MTERVKTYRQLFLDKEMSWEEPYRRHKLKTEKARSEMEIAARKRKKIKK